MASWRRLSFLKAFKVSVAALLCAALLGIVLQECAAACQADCCPPSACLGLNLDQTPASPPDAAPTAPTAKLVLLTILSFVAILVRFSPSVAFSPRPSRSGPGGRRALSRAQLHCWTL